MSFAGQRLPANYDEPLHRERAGARDGLQHPHDRLALNTLAELFPDREVWESPRPISCSGSYTCTVYPAAAVYEWPEYTMRLIYGFTRGVSAPPHSVRILSAATASSRCAILLAPTIGAGDAGFDNIQASAICEFDTPRRSAISAIRSTTWKSEG